jgi:hypothetical protein
MPALPMTASLTEMGLDANTINQLSPAGRKLTKGDLVEMWKNQNAPAAATVTVQDINVIRTAFGTLSDTGAGAVAGNINCCCCPCCCATAVVAPAAKVA